MRGIRLLLIAVMAVTPLATLPARAAQAPADVVGVLHDALINVMRDADKLGVRGRYDKIKPTLSKVYDFEAMTRLATGSAWTGAEPAQQAALTEAFSRFSIATYAERFKGFSGERFETLGERPGPRNTVIVDTKLIRPNDPAVALSYVLQDRGGSWCIIDVIVEGSISELAVRRSEYAQILRQGGAEKLVGVLNGKADEMLESGG